jgi:hypothetical protein
MDPYLEAPSIWPDVHHELISDIRSALGPSLRPHYVARVELRVYISDDDDPGREVLISDVRVEEVPRRQGKREASALSITEPLIVPTLMNEEIEEAFLRIMHVETKAMVTIIEIVSPSNKVRGARGRASFMAKRHEIMNSEVHWVEIDLLRAGVPTVTDPPLRQSDYRVLISRADQRTRTRFWPISVRQPLPVIGIPLRGNDPDAPLDLGAVLRTAYVRADYAISLDYRRPPEPPLKGKDAKWAKDLLRGHRGT